MYPFSKAGSHVAMHGRLKVAKVGQIFVGRYEYANTTKLVLGA